MGFLGLRFVRYSDLQGCGKHEQVRYDPYLMAEIGSDYKQQTPEDVG